MLGLTRRPGDPDLQQASCLPPRGHEPVHRPGSSRRPGVPRDCSGHLPVPWQLPRRPDRQAARDRMRGAMTVADLAGRYQPRSTPSRWLGPEAGHSTRSQRLLSLKLLPGPADPQHASAARRTVQKPTQVDPKVPQEPCPPFPADPPDAELRAIFPARRDAVSDKPRPENDRHEGNPPTRQVRIAIDLSSGE
jgi:hypothetical protein